MAQDISAQDALIFIDDQVPAFEETPQEHHIYVHSRHETLGSVETGDFIAGASVHGDSKLYDSLSWQ